MEYATLLAIILILGGLTGILYWASYAPDFLNEKFNVGRNSGGNSASCTALMSVGYFVFILIIIGGVIGLFNRVQL
jgi:uncharacterized membrane protein